MKTATAKSVNRLRNLLGGIGVGERMDLGTKHRKGYRFACGRTTSGTQARFWLGHDEQEAVQRMQGIVAVWSGMVRTGQSAWTPDLIKKAKDLGEQGIEILGRLRNGMQQTVVDFRHHAEQTEQRLAAISPAAAPAESPLPSIAGTGPSLHDAMDAYEKALAGKRVSAAHRWRVKHVLSKIKKVTPDLPMSQVDYRFLDSLADRYKARPKSNRGTPLAVATVKNILGTLQAFFTWCDDNSFAGWEGPRKLTRPFKISKRDLMTSVEVRKAGKIEQFDIPTLVKLYKAGTDRMKTIMLTALFSASTQAELAVMEKSEFDLDAGLLDHVRNKTGIVAKFWLPPELVTLLRADFKKSKSKPLAFYTRDGNPLVSFVNDTKICDSVLQMWNALREEQAKLPDALSFKYLRKFAGDYATKQAGESIGQAMLAHAPTTILGKHYSSTRDFDALHEVQKKMHAEFVAAGMFEAVEAPAK